MIVRKHINLKTVCLLLLAAVPKLAQAQEASVAWFTDAAIPGLSKSAKPADALPDAPGAVGNGVLLTKAVGIDNPMLLQKHGVISFWIKPNWNGNDSETHQFLKIGDAAVNGILIEKSAQNKLRFVMSAGGKTTAARADVSAWKAGEWHHISAMWLDLNSRAIGLPLYIDKVAVDGPIWGGTAFVNPASLTDKKVYIGDANSDAVMDELIFRNSFSGTLRGDQVATVYRDYFQTAPYTAVKINPDANFVPSDHRVINGKQKQFGLDALNSGRYEHVTDFAQRYSNWGDFDAKPYITWGTSNSTIATVDAEGLVTGKGLGHCTLTASFHGVTDTYDIEVISQEQPDLDLMYVERLPRYSANSSKKWPSEGETVQSVAHVANFGYQNVPTGAKVKFELMPDANANFIADDAVTDTRYYTIDHAMTPHEMMTVTFSWAWTQQPVWVRVTLDPDGVVPEICEANNQRCELNVARAIRWGYNATGVETDYQSRNLNGIGSFSTYDWHNAHTARVERMIRETVLPETSPDGVRDSLRVDNFMSDTSNWGNEWYADQYDGGFPQIESGIMEIDAAVCHELGHTCLGLPDLYGAPFWCRNLLVKDDKNVVYANTKVFPIIGEDGGSMFSTEQGKTQCGTGYTPLMDGCHLWLEGQSAGLIQHFFQDRGHPFWGIHGYLVPQNGNVLHVYDVNDQPLKGAAVYVYPLIDTPGGNHYTAYFPDRAKFIGTTDDNGQYSIPQVTDVDWDDQDSDQVEGATDAWNPFHGYARDTADTPNWQSSGGTLLVRIVSGTQTEFRMMAITEFNEAYFRGETSIGQYQIKTSLTSAVGGTPIVRKTIPDNIKVTNKKPVAVAPTTVFVTKGASFSIDGSQSYDPEGQPLSYRWRKNGTWDIIESTTSTLSATAPADGSDVQYCFWVIDGLRCSNVVYINVKAVNSTIRGQVTDASGRTLSGAIVGLKDNSYAMADAISYTTSDIHGNYTINAPNGYYTIAAWKAGWIPSDDMGVSLQNSSVTKNLVFPTPATNNVALNAWTWASDSGATTPASAAVDGSTSTGWATVLNPSNTYQSFIVDVGKNGASRNIGTIVIYWYGNSRPSDYVVDAMSDCDPRDLSNWNLYYSYWSFYSASNTFGGYKDTTTGCYINVLRFPWGVNTRGIRIRFNSWVSTAQYGIKEIQVFPLASAEKVSDIKALLPGATFNTCDKQISAMSGGGVPSGIAYIEETDRSCGLRVDFSGVSPMDAGLGDIIDLTGTVQQSSTTGEKYVSASKVNVKHNYRPLDAMAMTNRDASKTMALGLFSKLFGKVDSVGTDNFVINDGSGSPITVYCGDLTKPEEGQFVRVRGIIAVDSVGNCLLIQNQVDWTLGTAEYQPITIPGKIGAPRDYLLIGPFSDGSYGSALLSKDFISASTNGAFTESTIRPSIGDMVGARSWMRYNGKGDVVLLSDIFGYGSNSVAYAHIYIYSPIAQMVDIPLGASDGVAVWVNGSQVYRNDYAGWMEYGLNCINNVQLNAGLNRVLIKVSHSYYDYGFVTQFAVPGSHSGSGTGSSTPLGGLGYVLSNHM